MDHSKRGSADCYPFVVMFASLVNVMCCHVRLCAIHSQQLYNTNRDCLFLLELNAVSSEPERVLTRKAAISPLSAHHLVSHMISVLLSQKRFKTICKRIRTLNPVQWWTRGLAWFSRSPEASEVGQCRHVIGSWPSNRSMWPGCRRMQEEPATAIQSGQWISDDLWWLSDFFPGFLGISQLQCWHMLTC